MLGLIVHRKKSGMSQRELSEKSGVPQPVISDIENRKIVSPTVATAAKLAKVLGTTIEALVCEYEEEAERA